MSTVSTLLVATATAVVTALVISPGLSPAAINASRVQSQGVAGS
ncbi:hypothetical protein [Streptomyces melanogenes]|nr:hypothetical protein [Streptomyces melanogenes]